MRSILFTLVLLAASSANAQWVPNIYFNRPVVTYGYYQPYYYYYQPRPIRYYVAPLGAYAPSSVPMVDIYDNSQHLLRSMRNMEDAMIRHNQMLELESLEGSY